MSCVEWSGYKDKKGYGIRTIGSQQVRVHRLAWEEAYGPIPKGLYVCHRCDNRACYNVEHLFLGTQADNMADMVAKGRSHRPIGQKNGRAKLSTEAVDAIKSELSAGRKRSELARIYNVSWTTINGISSGRLWRTDA